MKPILVLWAALLGMTTLAFGQSSLFLRNSSWLDFDLHLVQKGSHLATPIHYNHAVTHLDNWMEDTEVFIAARDSTVLPGGQSVVYGLAITHGLDTVWMDFRLQRNGSGTEFDSRLHGNGFDTGYTADGNFHSSTVTIAGRSLELKYKADNDDAQQGRDIRLAIHETPIYTINASDFSDPNVLNVMAYNIQFLPLGVVGLPQAADRGDLLPAQLSAYQDVVIFEEVFDPIPRLLNLVPAMRAAGFYYDTGILNDYLPFNGGVIIFSRWPIEATAQYDFELCGPNAQDCLANKGIMYARIRKLDRYYNVFGTHFDAGSDSLDLQAKNLQYTEMKNFIAAQGIPNHEPVIWGGDLNTDAANSHNLYSNMLDSIDTVVPEYTGFPSSTMNRDTGDVIDHVFADPRYLLPLDAGVYITTFRSIEPALWELSDFSDHRCAISRFRFPDLGVNGGDQDLCPGDGMAFQSTSNIAVQRKWYHDGSLMAGVVGPSISIASTTLPDSGLYEVEMTYSRTYGAWSGTVNQMLYPNGPVARTAHARLRAGYVTVSLANCPLVTDSSMALDCTLFPNPTAGLLHLQRSGYEKWYWELRNGQGGVVGNGHWNSPEMEIDLQNVPAGLHILRIWGRGGQEFIHRVIVMR